jgi:hypothetical protein
MAEEEGKARGKKNVYETDGVDQNRADDGMGLL